MKQLFTLFILLLFSFSCIPVRIAPTIKEDKVMFAKKFKRGLPKNYAFIFEDPKDANEFYNYINTKYELNHLDVANNVPFIIEGEEYYLSFYETEISTKTINLLPIAIDIALESEGYDSVFEENQFSRIGNWYLVLTVLDSEMNDCLHPDYKLKDKLLTFLRNTRIEYLNTYNYNEALFRK